MMFDRDTDTRDPPHIIRNAARTYATGMLSKIDPGLAHLPKYIAFRSEAPPNVQHLFGSSAAGRPIAITCEVMDVGLYGWLKSKGRWLGRGFAMLFAHDPRDVNDPMLLGYSIHEFAHFCDDAAWGRFRASEPLSTAHRRVKREVAQGCPDDGNFPLNRGHASGWMRCVCHYWFRAKRLGYPIPDLDTVASTKHCGLVHAGEYFATLAREVVSSVDCSLLPILTTEPPAKFSKLWRATTARRPAIPPRQRTVTTSPKLNTARLPVTRESRAAMAWLNRRLAWF